MEKAPRIHAAQHTAQARPHASFHYRDMPRVWSELEKLNRLSAKVLQFDVLTAARSGAARAAMWSETNLKRRLWIIPATKYKTRVNHVIPFGLLPSKVVHYLI